MLGQLDPLAQDFDFSAPNRLGMAEMLDRLRDAGRKVAIVKSAQAAQAYLILGYEAVERAYTQPRRGSDPPVLPTGHPAAHDGQVVSASEYGWTSFAGTAPSEGPRSALCACAQR